MKRRKLTKKRPKKQPKIIQLVCAPWEKVTDDSGRKVLTSTMYALRDDGVILQKVYSQDTGTWSWMPESVSEDEDLSWAQRQPTGSTGYDNYDPEEPNR